jgi:hypothetical protein
LSNRERSVVFPDTLGSRHHAHRAASIPDLGSDHRRRRQRGLAQLDGPGGAVLLGGLSTSRAIGIDIPSEPTRAGSSPKMHGAGDAKQQLQASAS